MTTHDCAGVGVAEDGMATEDEEDEEELPPAEMHAEPASTAEAAQRAAQVAGQVKQANIQERTRLEEDAIGTLPPALGLCMPHGGLPHGALAHTSLGCVQFPSTHI